MAIDDPTRRWFEAHDVFTHIDEILLRIEKTAKEISNKLPTTPTVTTQITQQPVTSPDPHYVPPATQPITTPMTPSALPAPITAAPGITLPGIPESLTDALVNLLIWTQGIHVVLTDIRTILVAEIDSKESYFVDEVTVINTTAQTYNIVSLLRRPGRYGHLISDTGTIQFSMNSGTPITLRIGEQYIFDNKNHKINDLQITTTSAVALAFRLVIS